MWLGKEVYMFLSVNLLNGLTCPLFGIKGKKTDSRSMFSQSTIDDEPESILDKNVTYPVTGPRGVVEAQ